MNAKSRADFINSIAAGEQTPCPNCGTANKSNAKFCAKCGTKLTVQEKPGTAQPEQTEQTPFAPARPAAVEQTPFAPAEQVQKKNEEQKKTTPFMPIAPIEEEEKSAFALGLPSWNIDPPQIMVRRKKSK